MAEAKWMLDTNILSEMIRNPGGPVVLRLAGAAPDAICTSIIAACELRFGARRKGSAMLSQRVDQLLGAIPVLPFDAPADEHYAELRTALERIGKPIGSHDLLIAAHALSRRLVLVTHNLREFARVPGLQVEDWLEQAAPPAQGPEA